MILGNKFACFFMESNCIDYVYVCVTNFFEFQSFRWNVSEVVDLVRLTVSHDVEPNKKERHVMISIASMRCIHGHWQ